MKVFIIGGTGLVGPHVVELLQSQGADVVLFNRRGIGFAGTKVVAGDRRDVSALRRALAEHTPDVAIDMVAYTEDDARGFIDACRGLVGSIVCISSIDVYLAYGRLHKTEPGAILHEAITESSPLRSVLSKEGRDYNKLGIERILLASGEVPTSVLRLPMIYGPPDSARLGAHVRRMLDHRDFILLDSVFARWRVSRAFTRNCAEAIALSVKFPRPGPCVYNVSEPHSYSEREWINRIGRILAWRGEVVEVSDERWPAPFGIDARQDMVIDSSRIRTELGFREIVDCDAAIEKAARWAVEEFATGRRDELVDYQKENEIIKSKTV